MSNGPSDEIFRGVSLSQAIEDATYHLALGVRSILDDGWRTNVGQASFGLIAAGIEKLSKLTLMVEHEARTGAPLTDGDMKRGRGHKVEDLSSEVVAIIEQHGHESGNRWLSAWHEDLAADPYWPRLLRLLHQAASANEGRYRHAREFSGDRSGKDSPAGQWDDLGAEVPSPKGCRTNWSASTTGGVPMLRSRWSWCARSFGGGTWCTAAGNTARLDHGAGNTPARLASSSTGCQPTSSHS